MNSLKVEIDKQFIRVAQKISDIKSTMVNTKSDILKFVDNKFFWRLQENLVKIAGEHVDANLRQVASDVQTM